MKKAFLICPVRGHQSTETEAYVKFLEGEDWQVHWPHRDTNQDDNTGFHICSENLAAIREADKVFIIWDGKSQGSLFDAGMAFALGKPISVIQVPPSLGKKSFQDMLIEWERRSECLAKTS